MTKKNYTWNLDINLVDKMKKLAKREHRSLTNYIEVLFLEKIEAERFDENKSNNININSKEN